MTAYVPVDEPYWRLDPRPTGYDALGALVTLHALRAARGEISMHAAAKAHLDAVKLIASGYFGHPLETYEQALSVLGPKAVRDIANVGADEGLSLLRAGFEVAQA